MTDQLEDKITDVLIIGGGWTGVSAALELERLGVDYHLLEADPHRLGGRAFSYPYQQGSQRLFFDHGAQYIGRQQTEIWSLAEQHLPGAIVDGYEARIAYKDQIMVIGGRRYCYDRDECLFGIGGVPPDLEFWDVLASLLLVKEIEDCERAINVVEPWCSPSWVQGLDTITLADWSRRPWIPPTARELVDISVRSIISVRPEDVSAFYFFWYCACNGGFINEVNDEKDGPQQFYLSTGIGALVDKVAQGIQHKISFHSPVHTVDLTEGDGVLVTTRDGTRWRASKVILAMSPHTAGKLEYKPALPEVRKELMSQPMGRTIKCQVFYKEPWWRNSHGRHYTGYAGGANRPIDWVMDNSSLPPNEGSHCLMAFIVAEFVDALGPNPSKEAVAKLVTEELCFQFDDTRALSTSEQFLDLVFYEWNEGTKFIGGGPNTVFKPGILTGNECPARLLNEPWEDKVFFAASEMARKLDPSQATPFYDDVSGKYSDMRQSLGYMDGAIISGRFVANQVARALGRAGYHPGLDAAVPSSPLPADPPAGMAPPVTYTREQIVVILSELSRAFYAETAPQIPDWSASDWESHPEALMDWVATMIPQALAMSGIEPSVESLEGFIGAGYMYATEDLEALSDSDQKLSKSIRELSKVLKAMMRLKSSEPFPSLVASLAA